MCWFLANILKSSKPKMKKVPRTFKLSYQTGKRYRISKSDSRSDSPSVRVGCGSAHSGITRLLRSSSASFPFRMVVVVERLSRLALANKSNGVFWISVSQQSAAGRAFCINLSRTEPTSTRGGRGGGGGGNKLNITVFVENKPTL